MSDWKTIDYFFDESLVEDPYPYYDELRSACPVQSLDHLGVVAVTGYDEALEVYRDTESFSSCNSVIGPFATFPVPLEGDDVTDIIAAHRGELPMAEHMVTMDPPDHTQERALLMRLITPKRLKDNEDFMWRLADHQIDEFVAAGRCEFITAYAQPFAMLVVADLLGVPEEDHRRFREGFGLQRHTPARSAPGPRAARATTPSPGSTSGSPPTSRTAGASRARTCSPTWRWRRTPMAASPTSPRWCGPRRSCSRPDRRPAPACSPPRSSTSPSTRSCRTSSGRTGRRSPTSSRRCCGWRAP